MAEFLEDPSVLTKDKLKSQLVANNVSLPAGEQRKDVYVQLYLRHLTARNRGKNRNPDFSSDEEREATPLSGSTNPAGRSRPGRKATKKTDKPRPEDKVDADITKLSNADLKEQLLKYGVAPGPILASTRKVYEKKLAKLVEQGSEILLSTSLPTVSSTEDAKQNGNTDSEYSDNEEPRLSLRLEKREPLKGKLKSSVTLGQRRVEHNEAHSEYEQFESRQVINKVPERFKPTTPLLSIGEFSDMPGRTPKKPLTKDDVVGKTVIEDRRTEKDILKELFPFEISTPTGISASCRRPIRGAAGRPIQLSDYRMEESFSSRFVPKHVPLADFKPEKAKKGRSISIWIKILLFIVVAVFLFLVYHVMETNQGNPFAAYLSASDTSNVGESGN